jgi:integrase
MVLPNGCTCSEPAIYPEVRNKKSLSRDWYIQYYFKDPAFKETYKNGKLCIIKGGVNRIKTLAEREFVIQLALSTERQKLLSGYNPITKKKAAQNPDATIDPHTPLCDALPWALEKLEAVKGTKEQAAIVLRYVLPELGSLRMEYLPVCETEPRHVKNLLDSLSKGNFSPQKYNRYRANLMMLFKVLKNNFIIKLNPATDIAKKAVTQKLRQTLSLEERQKVNVLLKKENPGFHRFMHIFFHSGCRETELMQVKGKDVDLRAQKFRCVVRKRRMGPVEVEKTIKDIALPYWKEALQDCGTEDYVFSRGLQPGPVAIDPKQISRRWRLWIKKAGISADFYSLKHLHTTETVDLLGEKEAAKHNAHTTTAMVVKIYDVNGKGAPAPNAENHG